ncbi:MAG: tol-pal system protein YbgF [Kiloniellales bacterium]
MLFARSLMFRCLPALAAVLVIATSAPAESAVEDFKRSQTDLSGEFADLHAAATEIAAEHRALTVQLAQSSGLNAAQAAQFERRISGLEGELRRMTGRLEDLDFGIRQLGQRMDRFESETKARLLRLEQGQRPLNGETPSATFTPLDGSGPTVVGSSDPAAGQTAGGQLGQAQPGPLEPRTLGTISDQDLAGLRESGQAGTTGASPSQAPAVSAPGQQQALISLPSDDPQAAYNSAFDLLRQMDYPAAESAFSQYIELFPESDLAGNAKYWLGETHYVRGDYETAAVVFAEGYQNYPNSGKAPDNLLKLGMSLSNLGATQDACATFTELQRRYPDAAPTVLQRALREAQRLGCG